MRAIWPNLTSVPIFLLMIMGCMFATNVIPQEGTSFQTKLVQAKGGSAKAQYEVGWYYRMEVVDVSQDFKEAAKWWKKASSQGHMAAQFNLGLLYYFGTGVKQDINEALKW